MTKNKKVVMELHLSTLRTAHELMKRTYDAAFYEQETYGYSESYSSLDLKRFALAKKEIEQVLETWGCK